MTVTLPKVRYTRGGYTQTGDSVVGRPYAPCPRCRPSGSCGTDRPNHLPTFLPTHPSRTHLSTDLPPDYLRLCRLTYLRTYVLTYPITSKRTFDRDREGGWTIRSTKTLDPMGSKTRGRRPSSPLLLLQYESHSSPKVLREW